MLEVQYHLFLFCLSFTGVTLVVGCLYIGAGPGPGRDPILARDGNQAWPGTGTGPDLGQGPGLARDSYK